MYVRGYLQGSENGRVITIELIDCFHHNEQKWTKHYISLIPDLCRLVEQWIRGGGNQSTRRNPPTCLKLLTNFIT